MLSPRCFGGDMARAQEFSNMQISRVPREPSADDIREYLAAAQWLQNRDAVARRAAATFALVVDVVRASLDRQSGRGLSDAN